MGHISIFAPFCIFEILGIFDVFGAFWGFQLGWGVLRVILSYEVIKKDYIGCREGHWSVLGGVQRYFGGSRGAPRGSILPRSSTFCPSGSLVQHQNWFQVPLNGSTGQASPSMHHWPNFGPFKGSPKDHFMSKTSTFGTPETPKIPYTGFKMHFTCGDHTDWALSDSWDQI